jgi:hypothetical protein
MARALAVLAVAALLAVLLGRSYATCIDYWNSRQYRGPDLASALSICLREEPLPVLIALFLVVIAAGLARGIGPRAAVSLAAMALGVVALLGCAIEATSLLPVMRTGDGAGLALGLHWLTFLRLPGAAALVLGGALLYPHVAGGGAQGRFWTVLALAGAAGVAAVLAAFWAEGVGGTVSREGALPLERILPPLVFSLPLVFLGGLLVLAALRDRRRA